MDCLVYDTKELIKSIKTQRCLWDPSHEDYMNRIATQLAWVQVAKEIDKNWDEKLESQKSGLISTAQKKWRHLRDYYVKEEKKGNLNKNRHNIHFNLMGFLSGLNHKRRESQIIIRNEAPVKFEEFEIDESSDEVQSALSEPEHYETEVQHTEAVINAVAPFEQTPAGSISDDPDRGFLMSLLPEMRAMSDVEKFNFKYEVMTVLKRIKYSEADPFK